MFYKKHYKIQLDEQLQEGNMLYCFLDTNIFLQYQTFDEIDWSKILGAVEVCLVIPKKVIQELDDHKDDSKSDRRRQRARLILKKIVEYQIEHGGVVRPNVTLRAETVSPKTDWLELHGYNPADADDCIVGSVHYFQLNNPNSQLILFSGDYGVRLKAHSGGIPFLAPSEELRLSDEPDAVQKQNQQLQQELQRFKNAQPKLMLKIENSKDELSTIVDFQIDFEEIKLLEDEVKQSINLKFELLKYTGAIEGEVVSSKDNSGIGNLLALTGASTGTTYPSRKEVDTYHEQLNEFLQNEYQDYLRQFSVYANLTKLTRLIKLVLENKGTSPAKNVDVWVHFPDGIQIYEEIDSPPFEPVPPQKPRIRNLYDSILGDQLVSRTIDLSGINPGNYSPGSSGPSISIRKTNSYEIEWGTVDLKHNHIYRLPELYLLFEPIDGNSTGFEIEYRITADNLLDVAEGKLTILVNRS